MLTYKRNEIFVEVAKHWTQEIEQIYWEEYIANKGELIALLYIIYIFLKGSKNDS